MQARGMEPWLRSNGLDRQATSRRRAGGCARPAAVRMRDCRGSGVQACAPPCATAIRKK